MQDINKKDNVVSDKKKNDLLKKFLNAQQYTKTLKKHASNLIDDNNYATFSYDEIQTYPEIPKSAKLPSTKVFSKQQIYSIDTFNNYSQDFSIKAKYKKSHGHINLTQSSNQIPYMKNKKSSYSHVDKSQGVNKSISEIKDMSKTKQYDVHSVNKQKYPTQALHESLGGMKTESFFKLKNKKDFNYSNTHQYESQKLSAEDQHSFEHVRIPHKIEGHYLNQKAQFEDSFPYDLSPSNFMTLINKVDELQKLIILYQQAVKELKKKIISQQETIKSHQMSQLYIDSLKQQLLEQKVKSGQLRQKVYFQETHLKQYEQVMLESIQKVAKHYEEQITKITMLQKQNQFLKFMLRLEFQNAETEKLMALSKQNKFQSDQDNISGSKLSITKNLNQFKEKFNKVIDKNKNKIR